MPHYRRPDWFTTNVANRLVSGLTGLGLSLRGSRILYVKGRTSGEWRSNPVNLLTLDGTRYLVAPRGHTHWVRNLRAAGQGELQLGRRREAFQAVEIPDAEKVPILRGYLELWAMETGAFFDNVKATAPESELVRIAPDHPVFKISAPS